MIDGLSALRSQCERNDLAKQRIEKIALGHAFTDVAIGAAGSAVPGMGLIALAGSVFLQIPVYEVLVEDLAEIYFEQPDKFTTYIIAENTLQGAAAMAAAEFGIPFVCEIIIDLAREVGLAALASTIPYAGIAAGAALDFMIAATMTWRVGTMASMYLQNGNRWVGSRKATYEIAKKLTGPLSETIKNRVDLKDVAQDIPKINENLMAMGMSLVELLLQVNPHASDRVLREALCAQGFAPRISDEIIRCARKKAA